MEEIREQIDLSEIRISPSDINAFFFCPAKWYFANIAKIPAMEIPKPEMEFGSLVHDLIAEYYNTINGEPNDEFEIYDTLMKTFKRGIKAIKGYSLNEVKDMLNVVAKNFYRFELERLGKWKQYRPTIVEKFLFASPFLGKVDAFWAEDGIIVDWKTGKYRYGNSDLAIQGTIYYNILTRNGYKVNKILFVYLKNYKVLEVEPIALRDIEAKINEMLDTIRKGIFRKRNDRACAKCEYQLACQFSDLKLFSGMEFEEMEVVI